MTGLDPGDFGGTDRFLVKERLGAGGYGVVYRAVDRERNIPVALKTLRHVAAKALVRFKQEFRALADVSHPNLVTLYELSSHEDQWFFTMELVDGVNFLWYVRGDTYPNEGESTSGLSSLSSPGLYDAFEPARADTSARKAVPAGALNLERLRHALPQLAEGVLALHGAGKLHRDIKPLNVLVTHEGRVVLLDFGLVTELVPEYTHTVDAVGTPAYMSPEQGAGLPLTEASDWYNVGAMLYQALTGRLPFAGPLLEVMRQKQGCEPAAPRELAPDVPGDLDALCRDLLHRDPEMRPPDPPALLLIGCYRSEEAESSPLLTNILPKRLRASVEMRDIVVGELSPSEAGALALALVGAETPASRARAEVISRESGGNPYFIEELVHFSPVQPGPAIGAEVTLDQVIATRVSRLPEVARRLLDVVAVSGVPIEVGVAYRAADLEREGESALAVLRATHLVRTRSTLGRHEIETYHDRIRDAVVGHLTAEALKECHQRLASGLLGTAGVDPELLATHYLGAGDAESAAEYAAAAAAKASEALAFDRAARLYRFALNLGAAARLDEEELLVKLGDALANAGRGAEAAQTYLSASKGAGPALAIDLHRRAAQQFLISGHIEDGISALGTVLAKLGMGLPETPRRSILSLLVRRAQIRLRGLRFRERDESEVSALELLRIDTCWAVGIGMALVDMVRGADFQARHLVLALGAGEPYRVARALAMEGGYVAMGGNRSRPRAERLLQAARGIAERVNEPYATGLSALTSGIAAWLDGRWRDGRVLCDRGEEMLRERCTGVVWEILMAQLIGLDLLFFLGDLAELSRRLPSLLKDAKQQGNLLRATFLRIGYSSHVSWLAADNPEGAVQELENGLREWTRFDHLRLWARAARRDIALYSGTGLADPDPVTEGWRPFARALDRFAQVGLIRGLDSRARCRLGMAGSNPNQREAQSLPKGAEGHARAILREKTHWGDPLAHLIRAGAASTRGETERALGLLESAEAGFAAADMALHLAAARRRRGELLGGDAGRGLVAAANAWMSGQAIKNPERMTAMLAPGRWLQ